VATPHPRTLIAILGSTLRNIEDAVNGSIAATSISPSTEEEAFLYNLARDRGVVGAFGAASTFGPAAPQFVRTGRYIASQPIPQALEGGVSNRLNGPGIGNMPGARALPSPDRFRPNSRGWPSSSGSVPSVAPPAAGSAPSGGLLARLRELDAMERQASAAGPGLPAPVKDPNFRQLSRFPVLPTLEPAGSVAAHSLESLDSLRRVPEPQISDSETAELPDGLPDTSSNGGRKRGGRKGGGGGGGGGGRTPKYQDLCDKRKTEELNRCQNYKDDPLHPDYFPGCEDRATRRWALCYQHRGLDHPGPGEWRPGDDNWPGDEESWFNHSR